LRKILVPWLSTGSEESLRTVERLTGRTIIAIGPTVIEEAVPEVVQDPVQITDGAAAIRTGTEVRPGTDITNGVRTRPVGAARKKIVTDITIALAEKTVP
jgi:hypothetical protein